MVSTCPSCLAQVSHEEDCLEVSCLCGVRFNPTLDLPPLEDSLSGEKAKNFSESNNLFQELRDFGEAVVASRFSSDTSLLMNEKETPNEPSKPSGQKQAELKPPVHQGIGEIREKHPDQGNDPDCRLVTSTGSFEGYTILEYLRPISTVGEFNPQNVDPLRESIESLWNRALEIGGNGITGLSWTLSSDLSRVVMSGTAVKCQKGY